MTNDSEHQVSMTPELVKTLAAIAGVTLSDERARALAPQAQQHFALLRAIDALDAGTAEPQPEYHPDQRSAK
jgi:Asp-tRNA(Asn)/Glu-tRNA(Gln) amidotransferase C subunit